MNNSTSDKMNGMIQRKTKLMLILAVLLVLPFAIVAYAYQTIQQYNQYVTSTESSKKMNAGLVLGAGVTPDGKPYKELQARLDVAADALNNGLVNKLILSGDNRFPEYNEPDAMKRYLVEARGIQPEKLQPDYAGRSTYESCERAKQIFGLDQVMLFSAGSHLPRAIYLCRQFGVEAYGMASTVEANNSTRRELMANVKALYNVHISGEPTVLGEKIEL